MLAHIAAHEQIAAMIKLELLHAPAVREFSTAIQIPDSFHQNYAFRYPQAAGITCLHSFSA
jgi:hypothetical protein